MIEKVCVSVCDGTCGHPIEKPGLYIWYDLHNNDELAVLLVVNSSIVL